MTENKSLTKEQIDKMHLKQQEMYTNKLSSLFGQSPKVLSKGEIIRYPSHIEKNGEES